MMKLTASYMLFIIMAMLSVTQPASAKSPFEWEASYVADMLSNSGGAQSGTAFLNNLYVATSGDLAQAMGWQGGSVHLSAIMNQGDSASALTGDLQGMDNIEGDNATRILEAWLQQSFGSSSVLIGNYDLNSEFDVTDTAGLFINSSHGIGVDYSQTGPGLFPKAAPALRFQNAREQRLYWQVVYQQLAPDNPNGNLLAVEIGKAFDGGGKWALGLWTYDATLTTDVAGASIPATNNAGMYGLWDHRLGARSHYFVRYGVANARVNAIASYLGVGVVSEDVGFDKAQLGLAVAMANTGSAFQSTGMGRGETDLELSYRIPLSEHIALQPDLQYILSPGADPGLDNATVLGLRFEASL